MGFAYDSHRFSSDRKLVLGGIEIPSDRGLLGHSDADVLTHALMDALLGALAEGDIGKHFPDEDPQFKDISSLKLLRTVVDKVENSGYIINNCDLTLLAEKPKISPYRDVILNSLSREMNIQKNKINLKATTNEKMGFIGRGEGIAAYAAVSIIEKEIFRFFQRFGKEGSRYDVS
ncbi:MAG: 2-C-methyl-D-erythritol 2,4-cyclodiphosphate synthase [Bacillota bacterium]